MTYSTSEKSSRAQAILLEIFQRDRAVMAARATLDDDGDEPRPIKRGPHSAETRAKLSAATTAQHEAKRKLQPAASPGSIRRMKHG